MRQRGVFGQPSPEAVERFYTGMRPFWFPVLECDALEDGKPLAVELLGEPLVVVRLDGRTVVMQDLCRHYQAPLSLGEVVEWNGRQCLMCPYHGWTYGSDGRCVRIPQLPPDRGIPASARVPRFPVEERYGLIWVSLTDEPRFGLPDYPEFDDPSFRKNGIRTYEPYKASATRVLMGSLDDTHYPWVHEGLLGVREEPEPPDHKVWRHGDQYLTAQYTIQQPRSVLTSDESALGDEAEEASLETVTYTNTVAMPNTIRLVKDIDSSKQLVIWTTSTPHRYDLTSSYWRIARNFDLDPARDAQYEAFADKVREQDRPIWEGQRPWLLPPFWTKVELPIRPADQPLIGYQKWLEELEISIDV
jgi:phenylpropionate dioxygenase-like ring-hydroxylating dioxygenase large terminal subunit